MGLHPQTSKLAGSDRVTAAASSAPTVAQPAPGANWKRRQRSRGSTVEMQRIKLFNYAYSFIRLVYCALCFVKLNREFERYKRYKWSWSILKNYLGIRMEYLWINTITSA